MCILRESRKAGETVFYNSNILHCAAYDPLEQRATLHGCMGDVRGGTTRARNVLQHGLEWMRDDRFKQSIPNERGKAMLERLIKMADNAKGDIGYSLDG